MKMSSFLAILGVVILAACANCGSANADSSLPPWPDFQTVLYAAKSLSPVKAEFRREIQIVPPAPSVPPFLGRLSGGWTGWAGQNYNTDIKTVFKEVRDDGTVIFVYAAGSRYVKFSMGGEGKFEDNELVFVLSPSDNKIRYRIRPDGNLDFMWIKGPNDRTPAPPWVSGVLSKD